MIVPIWKLKTGDKFKLPGVDTILEFCRMDGAYAQVTIVETGEATLVCLCDVELVE